MEHPKYLLKGIFWSFDFPIFNSIEEFYKELSAYNEEIGEKPFDIDLNAEILKEKQVVIQYSYWDDDNDETEEPQFLLKADNNSFFTGKELLYKVNNIVCKKLEEQDHKFFEGFKLWEGENPNFPNTPLYFLRQGS